MSDNKQAKTTNQSKISVSEFANFKTTNQSKICVSESGNFKEESLAASVRDKGYVHTSGSVSESDPDNVWNFIAGLLIFGIGTDSAISLANKLGQRAKVARRE